MSANSILVLQHYIVKNMEFKINESFRPRGNEIELHPEFQRVINKIDENTAAVDLAFKIADAEESPFMLNICIEGTFALAKWESDESKQLMVSNTVAILFPYLRSLVSMITANANIPPYTLPVMNINELFDNAESENA